MFRKPPPWTSDDRRSIGTTCGSSPRSPPRVLLRSPVAQTAVRDSAASHHACPIESDDLSSPAVADKSPSPIGRQPLFDARRLPNSPVSPASGEKVADRPDEGASCNSEESLGVAASSAVFRSAIRSWALVKSLVSGFIAIPACSWQNAQTPQNSVNRRLAP